MIPLTKAEFRDRFYARFYDPAFDAVQPELERVFEKAWDGYGVTYRKSPRTQPAGPGDANQSVKLPVEWVRTKAAIAAAEQRQKIRRRQPGSSSSTVPRAASTPALGKSRKPCASSSMPGR